jgi:Ser/Thr protein kinase RdoA (MazF antagonist)
MHLLKPSRLYYQLRSKRSLTSGDLVRLLEVLQEYDLGVIEPLDWIYGGNRSKSLLVSTSQGKKVLKTYNQSLGLSTIIQEHSILKYLAQVGFPSARLQETKSRNTLVSKHENRYALFDFADRGFHYHHYILLPHQTYHYIENAAKTLASLHAFLKGFVPQGYNPDGFKSKNEDRWRDLKWIRNKLWYCVQNASKRDGSLFNSKLTRLCRCARYIETELERLDCSLREADLPRQIIHGDYGPYNLLCRKNAPAIILDFEMARLDWRLSDIIFALYRFSYGRFSFSNRRIRCFLDAYQSILPLRAEELRLFPYIWKFLNLRSCVRNWYSYYQTRNKKSLNRAIKSLDRSDWVSKGKNRFMTLTKFHNRNNIRQ